MKRIAISWPGFTGYTGPCFAALAKRCELRVFIEPSRYEQQFDASTMQGVPFHRVAAADCPAAIESVRVFAPDLTLVASWGTPLSRQLARAKIPGRKVLAFDMPWEWTLRKLLARWALRPLLRDFDAAFVPGRRCARYARWLGFRGERLIVDANSSGWERFSPLGSERGPQGAGRFLFVGRFVREKGIDVLLAAYQRYREQVTEPWPLDLVGSGEALPRELPAGVSVLGFVPPAEMPATMAAHACLVLPSRWEPWGVCVAEAMSCGLATIVSAVCGIVDDVAPTVRVKTGSVEELAAAFVQVTAMTSASRAAEAVRARMLAAKYSVQHWVDLVMGMADDGN